MWQVCIVKSEILGNTMEELERECNGTELNMVGVEWIRILFYRVQCLLVKSAFLSKPEWVRQPRAGGRDYCLFSIRMLMQFEFSIVRAVACRSVHRCLPQIE